MSEQIRLVQRVRFCVQGPQGRWWIEIGRKSSEGLELALVPLRTALPGDPAAMEWHLRLPDGEELPPWVSVSAPGAGVDPFGIRRFRGRVALRLRELARTGPQRQTLVAELLHGELILPLAELIGQPPSEVSLEDSQEETEFTGRPWYEVLGRLWPPAKVLIERHRPGLGVVGHEELRRSVSCLRIAPDGVYIQGRLPEALYPPRVRSSAAASWPEVVLRTPRRDEPAWILSAFAFTSPDRAPGEPGEPAAGPTGSGSTPAPSPRSRLLAAPELVAAALAALQDFQLREAAGQALRSLIESVEAAPGDDCRVRITPYRAQGEVAGLLLTADQLGTRLILGGGSGPDAAFTPEQLRALFSAPDRSDGLDALARGWRQEPLQVRSAALTAAGSAAPLRLDELVDPETGPSLQDTAGPPPLVLKLSRRAGPEPAVTLSYTGELRALSLPTLPVRTQDPHASENQAWLCLERGFLALNHVVPPGQVYLDPARYQPGAIAGVLDVGALMRDLGEPSPDDPELKLQAEAVASSTVRITALFAAPWQPDRLSLQIDGPLVVVQTPAVWLRELPEGRRPTAPPSLAGAMRALVGETSMPPSAQLDWQALFGPAVLATSALLYPPLDRAPALGQGLALTASVTWNGGIALTLHLGRHEPVLWWLPRGYPLAQSFPASPPGHQDQLCDDTRGLMPYRLAAGEPALRFVRPFPQLLAEPPRLSLTAPAQSIWRLAAELGPDCYYLPTLPGVELALTEPSSPSGAWRYRHAVPALDEAYGEVREQPATAQQPMEAATASTQRLVRVAADVAFPLALNRPLQATGWLPPTPDNPSGAIAMELESAQLDGREPSFVVKLATSTGPQSHTFRRPHDTDGSVLPDWSLAVELVEPQSETAAPRFRVQLGAAGSQAKEALRRHGQPLLARFSAARDRLVTLDAEGQLQEEAVEACARYYSLEAGALVRRERLTGSFAVASGPGTALHLELVGVNLGAAADAATGQPAPDGYQQQVALHDGQYGWPRLLGFPLALRKLLRLERTADELTVELSALWLPAQPVQPQDYANAGGVLRLELRGPVAGPLSLRRVNGELDWRLGGAPLDEAAPRLLRLIGTVDQAWPGGAPLGDIAVALKSLTVDLGIRSGELQLDPLTLDVAGRPGLRARIHNPAAATTGAPEGRLSFDCDSAVLHSQAGLQLTLRRIGEIRCAGSGELPIPGGQPAVRGCFVWALPQSADPSAASTAGAFSLVGALVYDYEDEGDGEHQKAVRWRLTIDRATTGPGQAGLLALPLTAQPVADRRLILITDSTKTLHALPPGSWFERARPDLGMVTVEFAAPDQLASLAADVRLALLGRKLTSPCGEDTRLQAHLRIESRRALAGAGASERGRTELWLTGVLTLRSDIRLRPLFAPAYPDQHAVSVFLDRALLPLTALPVLFLGEGPAQDILLGAVVEHRLQLLVRPGKPGDPGEQRRVRWQAPQVVRLTTAARYAERYLPTPVSKDSRLVVDLSAAFLLRRSRSAPTLPSGASDVLCPAHIELLLQGRPRELPQPGPGCVVRLPAAAGIAHFNVTLSLAPAPAKEQPSDGSLLHYPSLGALPAPLTLEEPDAEERDRTASFVKRSPQARWLSSQALCQALLPAPADPEPWLALAFVKKGRAAVTLPEQLSDLEWIRALPSEPETWLAAGLLMRQRREGASGETRVGPGVTLLEHPFVVVARGLQQGPAQDQGERRDYDTQIVCISDGQLRRLAHERVPIPQGTSWRDWVRRWALDLLQERRRTEPAVLLLDYAPDPDGLIMLPRLDEAQRADRAQVRVYRTEYGPTAPSQDPRVRESESLAGPLRAEADLRSTLFAAEPTGPPEPAAPMAADGDGRAVAATLLRLALTAAAPAGGGYSGRLRPAQAQPLLGSDGSERLLACHKWDEIPFTVQQGPAAFPQVARRPILQRPPLLTAAPSATGSSILPPLLDIVAWAARPGELVRTHLGFGASERLRAGPQAPSGPALSAAGPSQRIALRRPRARAGSAEQGRLDVVETRLGLGGRIEIIDLRLTQTLSQTRAPSESSPVLAVVTTRDAITPAAPSLAEARLCEPALVLVPPLVNQSSKPARPRDGETLPVLHLVADPSYTPHSDNGGIQTETQILLFRGDRAPVWDDLTPGPGKVFTVVVQTKVPSPQEAGWRELHDGQKVIAYDYAVRLDGLLTLASSNVDKDKAAFVGLFTLQTDPNGTKTLILAQAVPIAFLNQAGAIVAPKLALALLTADADPSLVGYRRLGPDDFTPLEPGVQKGKKPEDPSVIKWSRRADLRHVQRAASASAGARFDAVLFGPSGENIPMRKEP